MLIINLALAIGVLGSIVSLARIVDAMIDDRAARPDARLMALTRYLLGDEAFRFLALVSFLAATLIARFRVPGTLEMPVRWLIVAVPSWLTAGVLLAWWSKRRLLRDVDITPGQVAAIEGHVAAIRADIDSVLIERPDDAPNVVRAEIEPDDDGIDGTPI